MATVPPTIPTLPDAPLRNDSKASFIAKTSAWLAALFGWTTAANANATATYANALAAAAAASSAEAAAAGAAAVAGAYGTSITSRAIGTGSKSLELAETGRTFVEGMYVTFAVTASPSVNYMAGRVTDWDSGTKILTIDVPSGAVGGSGTYSAWSISLGVPEGLPAADAAAVLAATSTTSAVTPDALGDASTFVSLTDGATINWDTDAGVNAKVTLGGDRTMAAPTNLKDGWVYCLAVTQDGTGSRTLSWNGVFEWGQFGAPTLSTGADKVDFFEGRYSAATGKLHFDFRKAAT